ncbi:MAG TPA: hypothetical protein VJB60_02560 [Candidatus Peribacterales bacterium]|nr:hypothetical protein [Candidatus Peribacterales bacterium]
MHSPLITRRAILLLLGIFVTIVTLNQSSGGSLTASIFDGAGLLGGLFAAQAELPAGVRTDTDVIFVIADIINFALMFVAIIAVIGFIVAGFMFILGFGSDASIQRAKKIMIWSVVGLLVIIFAFVIVQFVVNIAT